VTSHKEISENTKIQEENLAFDFRSRAHLENDSHIGHNGHIGHSGHTAHNDALPTSEHAPTITVPVAANDSHGLETGDVVSEEVKDAAAWLRGRLADGPEPSVMVRHDTNKAGYSWSTLKHAKEALGVRATKDNDVWYWRPPSSDHGERYAGME